MTITAEQYAAWLADDNAERLVLAEMSYRDIAAGTDGVIYVGTMPFLTASGDSPALQLYEDIILEVPEITRRLKPSLMGAAEVSYGDLTIDNANGELDSWFDYAFEGRSIVLYLGDPTWSLEDIRSNPIFVGTVEDVIPAEEDIVSVRIRDNMWYLNAPVLADTIGGNGPNAGEQEPICVGGCFNVEGILYDSATDTFKLSKGPIYQVVDVRDNGASLVSDYVFFVCVASTDLLTSVVSAIDSTPIPHNLAVDTRIRIFSAAGGLSSAVDYWVIASGLTSTSFKVSATRGGAAFNITSNDSGSFRSFAWNDDLTNGRIELVAAPAGRITADVLGVTSADSPTEWVSTIGEAIYYLVTTYTSLPLEFIDVEHLLDYDFAEPLTAGPAPGVQPTIGLRVSGGETVADLIDQLVSTANAFFTFDRQGTLRIGRVRSPEGGDITWTVDGVLTTPDPVLTITEDDVDEDAGISHVRRDNVLGVLETGFFRNWTPMPDGVAGSVWSYAASLLRSEYVFEGASGGIVVQVPPDNHSGTVFETYPLAERVRQLTLLSATTWRPMFTPGGSGVSDIPFGQAESWRDYWLHLRVKPRTTDRLPVNASPFGLNLGDLIEAVYPCRAYTEGANVIVVGIIEQPDEASATLEIWK